MATISHKNLSGNQLHENKGASTATDDHVATVTTGATVWKKLTHANLTTTGNPFGGQLLHVRDEKASGTDGGTFTSGAWRTRTLNTSMTNEISGASLASNQITLPAGTYFIEAWANGNTVDGHVAKLRNVTDGTDTLIGSVENTSTNSSSSSWVRGRFTIAAQKVFELQHQCDTTAATIGFGNSNTFGVVEVYADVCIWKVA